MSLYRFSNLSDGQAIRFNPEVDDLWFDRSEVSAADVRVTAEGPHSRIEVVSGPYTGRDFLLLNTAPQQLATSNVSFTNTSRLLFGDDSTAFGDDAGNSLTGTRWRDHLAGFGGDDTLDGGDGADYMSGGAGNDLYFVTAGDTLVDESGIDTVISGVNWNLAEGFENLTLTGTAIVGGGNSADNRIEGNIQNNIFNPREGNDTVLGGAGNDTINISNGSAASYGQESIDGGEGIDTVDFGANARSSVLIDLSTGSMSGGGTGGAGSGLLIDVENAVGGNFADTLIGDGEDNFFYAQGGDDSVEGGGGNDRLEGVAGNDTIAGGEGNDFANGGSGDDWLYGGFRFATSGNATGNDTLTGGSGRDSFVFNDNPNPFISSPAATVDRITDFVSRTDTLAFDDAVFPGVGAPGRFEPGDERFYAARGATTGHDETDRIIYDTSTGGLYYDGDGAGGLESQLIAILSGRPTVIASDIAVV